MLLVSYWFAAFVAAALLLYYLVPGKSRWAVLLLVSYGFYACGGPRYLIYPAVTTISTWALAKKMGEIAARAKAYGKEQNFDREQRKAHNQKTKKEKRRYLIPGLLLNFGILAVLKGSRELGLFEWVLPLGISYYTFQSMGYLIDVYQQKYEPEQNLAKFALFVSYFPQMTAGPIGRFDKLGKELLSVHEFRWLSVKLGLERILWGYFKKLVIADRIGPAAALITENPEVYGGFYVFLGILGHVLQLYADFSGGMDIVIGVSQMFGISLAENFERPFFSRSLAEFWRRWHISLTQWFREYIFFPVSGSRAAKKLSELVSGAFGKNAAKKAPVYLATLTVWFVTGIWHGTTLGWILWGLSNGVILLLSQELEGVYKRFRSRFSFSDSAAYRWLSRLRTFLLFCFTWMFVYYPLGEVFPRVLGIFTGGLEPAVMGGLLEVLDLWDLAILAFGLFLFFFVSLLQEKGSVRERLLKAPVLAQYLVFFGLFLLVLVTGVYGQGYDASQFIYNRF